MNSLVYPKGKMNYEKLVAMAKIFFSTVGLINLKQVAPETMKNRGTENCYNKINL